MQNPIRIDIKGDFDLRYASWRRRDPIEMECPQRLVVASHRTLALKNFDLNARLIIGGGRKDIFFSGRYRRVPRNHDCRNATCGFNREQKRSHIKKQHILHISAEYTTLNSGAYCNNLIRIHTLVRFLANKLPGGLNHLRLTSHTAHEHPFAY